VVALLDRGDYDTLMRQRCCYWRTRKRARGVMLAATRISSTASL
jgi:hypothetical protein